MFCEKCGSLVNDGEAFCSNCGAGMNESSKVNNNSADIKTTSILVFSIIELICVNQLFGLISLILYFAQLRPAIDRGDVENAKKSKKTITILLIIGLVLNVLAIMAITALIFIPNFSGIQARTEVRYDMVSASQVGKAVRMWYTDATTGAGYDYDNFTDSFVRIDELDGIELYVDPDLEPRSYGYDGEDGAYYATVTDEGPSGKVVVAIGPENLYSARGDYGLADTFYGDIDENVEMTYTGGTSGIAYVEQ